MFFNVLELTEKTIIISIKMITDSLCHEADSRNDSDPKMETEVLRNLNLLLRNEKLLY